MRTAQNLERTALAAQRLRTALAVYAGHTAVVAKPRQQRCRHEAVEHHARRIDQLRRTHRIGHGLPGGRWSRRSWCAQICWCCRLAVSNGGRRRHFGGRDFRRIRHLRTQAYGIHLPVGYIWMRTHVNVCVIIVLTTSAGGRTCGHRTRLVGTRLGVIALTGTRKNANHRRSAWHEVHICHVLWLPDDMHHTFDEHTCRELMAKEEKDTMRN